MRTRRYSELRQLATFEERYKYLKLTGEVGVATFGFDRYLNQAFYRSHEWRMIRNHIVVRDNGCDLGIEGYDIHDRVYVHHINPVQAQSLLEGDSDLLDPEYLITTTHKTHNAIHFGDERLLPRPFVERRRGDTKLW